MSYVSLCIDERTLSRDASLTADCYLDGRQTSHWRRKIRTTGANSSSRPQRGSDGKGASVAKRKIVVEWNSCPGFSSVVGKLGLLGLSGKCCVSSVNPSVWR